MVTKLKDIRENQGLKQQELAELAGVSRQTIYFLEKGTYNPKLTLSFKIAEILKKPLGEIFYLEPIIIDIMGGKTLDELEEIAKKLGIPYEKLTSLRILDEDQLSEKFNEDELNKIADALGENFDDLFIED